ncbi:MAG: DUF1573 domain-containing protein [Deltaproteobacteria bacterium]|nr:DUF1573 domain-containing protein [Deltaproteobacteria bacterium]
MTVEGETIEFTHSFRLENHTSEAVPIREVRANCGCLVADEYAKTIPPGGATDIDVTLSVFGPPGVFRKTLVVFCGDTGQLPLSIRGRLASSSLMFVSPTVLEFGEILLGESKTRKLTLARYDGTDVRFQSLETEKDAVATAGEPVSSTRTNSFGVTREYLEVPIRFDARSLPSGSVTEWIVVKTASPVPSTADLRVKVHATIVEMEKPWVEQIFVERLGPAESTEVPIVKTGHVVNTEIASYSYEGDESISVELMPGGGDGESTAIARARVIRSPKKEPPRLARGVLRVRPAESNEQSAEAVEVNVVVFLAD